MNTSFGPQLAFSSILRKPKRDNPKIFFKSEKIFRIDIFKTNRFWKGCQIEKPISNPGLTHRSTNNFHQIEISSQFKNLSKIQKICADREIVVFSRLLLQNTNKFHQNSALSSPIMTFIVKVKYIYGIQ